MASKAQKKQAVETNKALTALGESRSVVGTAFAVEEIDRISDSGSDDDVVMAVVASPCLGLAMTNWCTGCRDYGDPLLSCTKCKHRLCGACALGSTGCICLDTLTMPATEFICPDHVVKGKGIGFLVQGYSAGNYNEILWPLAMTTLLLRSIRDQYYAASCIALDLKYEYRTAPSNIYIADLKMQTKRQRSQQKYADAAATFLRETVSLGILENTILFIDTHACSLSGCLQFGGGKTDAKVANLHDLVKGFVGKSVLVAMRSVLNLGTQLQGNTTLKEKYPSIKITNTGGLRIVIIMSCGPALMNVDHLRICREKIIDDVYDLILGFTGESTLLKFVINDMLAIISLFAVNQGRDIWSGLEDCFKHAERLLLHSAVMALFKDGDDVRCRQFGLHNPPSRVLGIDFFCRSLDCHTLPGELRYTNKRDDDVNKEKI